MAESGKPNPFAAFAHLSLQGLEDTLGVFYTLAVVGYGFTFFRSRSLTPQYLFNSAHFRNLLLFHPLPEGPLVAALCMLDTTMSALSSHTLYYYLVTMLALPVTPDDATSSFCVEAMISAGAAGLSIASTVLMMRNTPFANFAQAYMTTTIGSGQGLRVLSGLLITSLHAIYAYKAPRKEAPSLWEPVVNLLASGLGAVTVQAVCLITFVAMPNKLNTYPISHGRGLYAEETQRISANMDDAFSEVQFAPRELDNKIARTIVSDADTVLGGKGYLSNRSEDLWDFFAVDRERNTKQKQEFKDS
ncbi:hypothetical protein C8J57DRAFT_1672644 [Mycena rebaudengoi]|nr:hypothetical protein C8J57DRAFT_1672644 [Mycena rebaudengoi]